METSKQDQPADNKNTQGAKKAGPTKLPSKQITFGNQGHTKSGKQAKTNINKSKKGGVNLMKKLSGM